jgi:hypothetical protein
MKKKILISVITLSTIAFAMWMVFLLGVSHAAYREVEAGVAMDVALLELIEGEETNRAISMIETLLVGKLNALEAAEESKIRYGLWYFLNVEENTKTSGERWVTIRKSAEERVKVQRDEWNKVLANPEKAIEEFEGMLSDKISEKWGQEIEVKVKR